MGAAVSVDEFPVAAVPELYATPVLQWRDGAQVRRLVHRRDFAEHLACAELPQPRTGQLATADAARWRDRWVLVPSFAPAAETRARDEGAAGLLVPRGMGGEGWLAKLLAGPPAGSVPVLAVRAEVHQQMATLANTGYAEVSASVPLRTVAATGVNVIGVLAEPAPGSDSVLLAAHFDGVGDDPDRRLPAAADNASGVAVVLEATRLIAAGRPGGMGLTVALLDAEEVGALGSARHAAGLPAGTYVINVDGAGRLGEAAVVEAGGPASPLLAALDRAGRQGGVALRAGAVASDNRRYAAAGLPAIGPSIGFVALVTAGLLAAWRCRTCCDSGPGRQGWDDCGVHDASAARAT